MNNLDDDRKCGLAGQPAGAVGCTEMGGTGKSWALAARYHQETKHHFRRFARSLGYMDWASQPNPFRRYEGAPLVRLKLGAAQTDSSYDQLFKSKALESLPATLSTISDFLEHALALSAWKEFHETRWALRINPSSGNLHPTEGYLITDSLSKMNSAPSVFHYAPEEHALEQRCSFSPKTWQNLTAGFPPGTFFVGLTSIHWREAWKYGERAYRYCQHDVGHAIAAISISAAINGWRAVWLREMADRDVASLLGIDRASDLADAEREHPDLLLAIVIDPNANVSGIPLSLPDDPLQRDSSPVGEIVNGDWCGKPNRLSRDHVDWPLIDETAAACEKPAGPLHNLAMTHEYADDLARVDRPAIPARTIIKQRRSAVAMDGSMSMSAAQFFLMLDRTLPRFDRCPWWSIPSVAYVHLCLFVHRVEGLARGLYFLVRSPEKLTDLQDAMDSRFVWTRPANGAGDPPLFLLNEGDYRQSAGRLSCGQAIATDGVFSLGMIAEFEAPLRRHGAWFYRRLFWEAGMIGQVLYLEAEAAGLRATGIGCYFDDPVHDVLGLHGQAFQSLYHFAVGGPVEDTRLTTLPPYEDAAMRGQAKK